MSVVAVSSLHPSFICWGSGISDYAHMDCGKLVSSYHLPMLDVDSTHWYAYSNCVHNVLGAFVGRVALPTPDPTEEGLAVIANELNEVSKLLKWNLLVRDKMDTVVQSFSGLKRRKYEGAHEKIKQGQGDFSGKFTAFVKYEIKKYNVAKPFPAPRLIQFAKPEYNLELLTYLRPIDRILKNQIPKGYPKTRHNCKGLNMNDMAQLMVDKFNNFPGGRPWIYPMDAAKFDGSIHISLLREEFKVYNSGYRSERLKKLLQTQLKPRGKYRRGATWVKYKRIGSRGSGTPNTSTGNGILMAAVLNAYGKHLRTTGVGEYDFGNNGDDSLFFSKAKLDNPSIRAYFKQFGMDITSEEPTQNISKASFCQARIVFVDGKPRFIRTPENVIRKSLISDKYKDVKGRPMLVKSIGQAELSLNVGVPVLQEFSYMLFRSGQAFQNKSSKNYNKFTQLGSFRYENTLVQGWTKVKPVDIVSSSRSSFEEAFGWSIDYQLYLEDLFRRTTLPLSAEDVCEPFLSQGQWIPHHFRPEIMPRG